MLEDIFLPGGSWKRSRNVSKLFSCPDWRYLSPFLSCYPKEWSLKTVGLAAQGTPGILHQWQPQQHPGQTATPKASLKKLYSLQEQGSQEIYLLAPCWIFLLSSSHQPWMRLGRGNFQDTEYNIKIKKETKKDSGSLKSLCHFISRRFPLTTTTWAFHFPKVRDQRTLQTVH